MTLNATCLVLICRCRCLERGWLVQTGCMSTGPVCCEALELGNSIKFRAILWSFTFQLLYSMAKAILGAGDARSRPNIESAICTDKRESHSTRLNPVFSTCKSPCGFNLPRLLPAAGLRSKDWRLRPLVGITGIPKAHLFFMTQVWSLKPLQVWHIPDGGY